MKKDYRVFLDDILESINRIEEYTKLKTKKDFNKNSQVQDAVIRRLEIIGEASKHLPAEFKKKHSEIPWKKVTGLRNVVAHEYQRVNMGRIWETTRSNLPELKKLISDLPEMEET